LLLKFPSPSIKLQKRAFPEDDGVAKMDKIVNSFYIYIHASMFNVKSLVGECDGKKVSLLFSIEEKVYEGMLNQHKICFADCS
jgi:hypothetical protein